MKKKGKKKAKKGKRKDGGKDLIVSRSQTAFFLLYSNIKRKKAVWLRETMNLSGHVKNKMFTE